MLVTVVREGVIVAISEDGDDDAVGSCRVRKWQKIA